MRPRGRGARRPHRLHPRRSSALLPRRPLGRPLTAEAATLGHAGSPFAVASDLGQADVRVGSSVGLILLTVPVQDVVSRPPDELVLVEPSREVVVTGAAEEHVIPVAPIRAIVAASSGHLVGARARVNRVVVRTADELVPGGLAEDEIVPGFTLEQVMRAVLSAGDDVSSTPAE